MTVLEFWTGEALMAVGVLSGYWVSLKLWPSLFAMAAVMMLFGIAGLFLGIWISP